MNFIDQVSQVFIVRNHEVQIEAAPRAIWPHLLKFENFNKTFEKVEVLSGKENTVGAISLLTKEKGELYMPPYLVKIVEMKPEKQIVWKMYPRTGDEFYCFVDFRLEGAKTGTKFIVAVYSESQVPLMSDAALAEYKAGVHKMYDSVMDIMLPNLKNLSEGRAA